MTQKNETTTLILTLAITAIIVGGGFWVFNRFQGNQPTPTQSSNVTQTGVNQIDSTQTNSERPPPETFAEVKDVPSGLFNYGGSTTWAPIRKEIDVAIQTVYPKFKLRYTDPISGTPGSGTGIKMLLDNQLAFSQSSRSVTTKEYQQAEQKGFTLKEIPVAIDGIAIAVNPNLNIPGITISQLKDIYTGKIRNWSEVGGDNIPIIPYSRSKEAGGTVEFFVNNVMEEEEFGDQIEYVYGTTQGLRKVAANQGGIYYASAPEVVPQCTIKTLPIGRKADEFVPPYQPPFIPLSECPNQRNQLNQQGFATGEYPITRRLFVIVKQNGQEDESAGLAYAEFLLTNQGQELINQAGFVPIR
jgi:phosphate transport system substrate-binding protein